jgi:erythrin-vacuolar iron transport family protein
VTAPKTTGIDFATLTLKDALDLAVLIEEEARDRYEELAAQLVLHRTPVAASFFTKMVRVEELHRTQLLQAREKRFGTQPIEVRREQIWDVEAPEYDEARMNMTQRQALEVALRSEEKAHHFFVEALKVTVHPEVRSLFQELCDEELEHQDLVKAELAKLAPGHPHDALDVGDGPAPQ